MKTKGSILVMIIAAAIMIPVLMAGCTSAEPEAPAGYTNGEAASGNSADALRFKEEHEVYNGQLRDNGEPHLDIYIPANNRVVYLEFDALMDFIDSGTGVFFFSRPTCPWCRVLLPTFLEVAEVAGMYIYYYDIDYDREAHNQNYVRILEALHNYLPVDDRSQSPDEPDFDENLKRVTVPHLFFMQDGQVINEVMMNRHPLLVDEDMAGLYSFLLEMFRSIPMAARDLPCIEDC
ncbi:MAG: hypothetical protein FWC66_06705 [Oscillospiraceae bacterium]|nr:hypothetical protein [Oscillospiraceae bacterium]